MKKMFIVMLSVFMILGLSNIAIADVDVTNQQQQIQVQAAQGGGGGGGGAGGSGGSVGIASGALSPAAVVDFRGAFNGELNRMFPIPGSVMFPGTPSYFGPPTPGQNFIPLSKLTMYNVVWEYKVINKMVKDKGWGGMNVQVRRLVDDEDLKEVDENGDTIDLTEEQKEQYIKIFTTITKPANAIEVRQVAFATIATTNDKKISVDTFSVLMKKCYESGGNVIHFMAEGINRKMRASGWGVGINNSTSVMSSGQGLGNVAVGGLGYTNGTSGYVDRPWMQATFLKVLTKDGEPLAFEPPPITNPQKLDNDEIKKLKEQINELESRKNTEAYIKSKS